MFLHCGTNDAARSVSALGALEDSYEAAHSVFESSASALARSDATVADGFTCAALADGSAALELIANPENHDEVHDGTAEFVAPIVSHFVHSLPLQTEEVVRNAQENATETLADGGSDDSDLAGTAASDRQPECYVPTDTPNRIDTQASVAGSPYLQQRACNMQRTACIMQRTGCNIQHAHATNSMEHTRDAVHSHSAAKYACGTQHRTGSTPDTTQIQRNCVLCYACHRLCDAHCTVALHSVTALPVNGRTTHCSQHCYSAIDRSCNLCCSKYPP